MEPPQLGALLTSRVSSPWTLTGATVVEPCLLCFRRADPACMEANKEAPPRSLEQVGGLVPCDETALGCCGIMNTTNNINSLCFAVPDENCFTRLVCGLSITGRDGFRCTPVTVRLHVKRRLCGTFEHNLLSACTLPVHARA